MDHFDPRDGVVHCEDLALPAIAEGVGTPVDGYSSATLERHAQVFREAVGGRSSPSRSRPIRANAAAVATLAAQGLGGDVVSIGEYRRAIAA